jgi:hypothetical protein
MSLFIKQSPGNKKYEDEEGNDVNFSRKSFPQSSNFTYVSMDSVNKFTLTSILSQTSLRLI